jgi:N-acetylglutamate synthase-like GNAT family acetyltransferase
MRVSELEANDVQVNETVEFAPGSYWTRELAGRALARMTANLASEEMQALMRAIAEAAAVDGDPAAVAADMGLDAPAAGGDGAREEAIERAACVVRRGRPEDIAALAMLIVHGELPPLFIEEFVEGFCVVEHRGEIIGCGGLELYGPECGVIRSVVVRDRGRGLGLGALMSRLLIDDARAYGARDLYLFTMHAAGFWEHLGFRRVDAARWRPEARANWQNVFITTYPEAVRNVISMWMPVSPATGSKDPPAG